MIIATIISLFTGSAKKPLFIALACALLLLALTGGYFYARHQGYQSGYTVAEHQFLKEKDEAVALAIKTIKRKNQSNQEIATLYWKNELAKKPKIQTIEKRIVEYVEVNNSDVCQLDDDELLILQDLISTVNSSLADPHNR